MSFQLEIPNETRLRFFKMKSERREPKTICTHHNKKTSYSPGSIQEVHCADCGVWLYDKDVS